MPDENIVHYVCSLIELIAERTHTPPSAVCQPVLSRFPMPLNNLMITHRDLSELADHLIEELALGRSNFSPAHIIPAIDRGEVRKVIALSYWHALRSVQSRADEALLPEQGSPDALLRDAIIQAFNIELPL